MGGRSREIFIHPLASVDPGTSIGNGTRIWQYTVVKQGAEIGEDCNIGSHCYVEWGVRMGNRVTVKNGVSLWEGLELAEGVFVGPNAVFTNDLYPRSPRALEARDRYQKRNKIVKTTIEYGSTVGAGAMILAGVTIGCFASVGLGAVVIRSVPPHAVVVGNPARQIGWICECGLPLFKQNRILLCKRCLKKYKPRKKDIKKIS